MKEVKAWLEFAVFYKGFSQVLAMRVSIRFLSLPYPIPYP